MMFNLQIGAFLNIPLILHKVGQKNRANYSLKPFRILPLIPQQNSVNYPLPIFRTPHFTIAQPKTQNSIDATLRCDANRVGIRTTSHLLI